MARPEFGPLGFISQLQRDTSIGFFWDAHFSDKVFVCAVAMNNFLRAPVAARPAGELLDLGQEGFAVTGHGADGP
jgi:hypothetical protein